MTERRQLVVVGNGMVGHKLLEALADRGGCEQWNVVTFAEETRPAYDRVGLSSFFIGSTAADLSLVADGFFEEHGITVHLGDPVTSIDPAAHTVTSAAGRVIGYDALVLATGSYPFVPPVTGHDVDGAFARNYSPFTGRVIIVATDHLCVQLNCIGQSVVVDYRLEIGKYLGSPGVKGAPFRVWCK